MLSPLGWKVGRQSDWGVSEAIEDGLSFIENALIKARHASKHTGLPALGDDSGLVVDALQGAPGIYSARYAGADADDQANNRKLLRELEGVSRSGRTAHFYCAMALVRFEDDPAPIIATGAWHGVITDSPAGVGGFGYDPLFWIPGEGCTSAELPAEKKNRLSHRGRALAQMLEQLATF
ncbi:RdgB/HAM1 family non-canonical purine NTP pyrophosphatase [Pseudomonadota bacterium]